MPLYLARFDYGPAERFDAADDTAAREEVRGIISDSMEDDVTAALYRVDDGGRGDEEYLGEVTLDDDGDE